MLYIRCGACVGMGGEAGGEQGGGDKGFPVVGVHGGGLWVFKCGVSSLNAREVSGLCPEAWVLLLYVWRPEVCTY